MRLPTEKERALAAAVAASICEHLQQASAGADDLDSIAVSFATEIGELLTMSETTDYAELFASATENRLLSLEDGESDQA